MAEIKQKGIKTADWIIDMGPEGGKDGGRVIARGTQEKITAAEESATGYALRKAIYSRIYTMSRNILIIQALRVI